MSLTVGISGAGNISQGRHIPAFRNHDETRVVGIYDPSRPKREAVADEYNISPVDEFEGLCSMSDVISVCSPPWYHYSQTVTALENGCHVLTEKPMAMNKEEAKRMVSAAEDNHRVLSVVHNLLYMDAVKEARRIVQSGEIGEVRRTYMPHLLREGELTERHGPEWFDMPGGVFWDEAPHMMYMTEDFLGSLEVVDTGVTTWDSVQPYDSVRVTFEGESGGRGQISVLYDTPITEWWFVIVGTEGIIFIDIFRETIIQFDREGAHSAGRVLSILLSGLGQIGLGGVTTGIKFLKGRVIDNYQVPRSGFPYQVDGFVKAVTHGGDPPITGEDGRVILDGMVDVGEAAGFMFQDIEGSGLPRSER